MKGYCIVCGAEIEVTMCCSGKDCGCMGQPTDPPVCDNCYDEWYLMQEQNNVNIGEMVSILADEADNQIDN